MDYIKPAIENALKWDYDNNFPMGLDLREDLRTALHEITGLIPALAHRDEQVKGLVEALKNINQLANKYAGDYPTQIGTISQAALAAVKGE